ncbi:MAG: SRPBCC family protein, partial [Bradymonadaceae bacterium]
KAPIHLVWQVLTDLSGWPQWNPDVQSVTVHGEIGPGTTFKWKAGGARLVSKLQDVDPLRKIAWTGRSLGIRAAHVWHLREHKGGTRVVTEESFEGVVARLFADRMWRILVRSLENGLEALRLESERRVGWKSKIFTSDEARGMSLRP